MNTGQLLQIVDDAFGNSERPSSYSNGCPCDECAELEAALEGHTDRLPDGLEWQLPLLSPETLQYLMPLLFREALADAKGDLADNLIDMFGQPVSKSDPPKSLPFARSFSHAQTVAVLQFLRFARDCWYRDADELPRQHVRGIVNWEYFAKCAARTA